MGKAVVSANQQGRIAAAVGKLRIVGNHLSANAKTKLENGFDLSDYDERCLKFAKDYSQDILAVDVNIDTTEMLDKTWEIFGNYFRQEEVNIKQNLVDTYWKN